MKTIIRWFVLILLLSLAPETARSWESFRLPRVIAGGSAGYFYLALDDFKSLYSSKWDRLYSGNVNIRVYRGFYLSLQYAQYLNKKAKDDIAASQTVSWDERFVNVGIRRYLDTLGKWNLYSGLGFVFISITELPDATIFENNTDGKTKGKGFYFELGSRRALLPNLGLFLEFEISSAGEGGTPGFVGYNIGGYAFQCGLELNF